MLGTGRGGKALLVAASTKHLIGRGVTAPVLLEPCREDRRRGAGGKPNLAVSGGPRGGLPGRPSTPSNARLKELLQSGG